METRTQQIEVTLWKGLNSPGNVQDRFDYQCSVPTRSSTLKRFTDVARCDHALLTDGQNHGTRTLLHCQRSPTGLVDRRPGGSMSTWATNRVHVLLVEERRPVQLHSVEPRTLCTHRLDNPWQFVLGVQSSESVASQCRDTAEHGTAGACQ